MHLPRRFHKVLRVVLILGSIAFSGAVTVACAPGFEANSRLIAAESSSGLEVPSVPVDIPQIPNPGAVTPTPAPVPVLDICSKLDFADVIWPSRLIMVERKAMALALNITGSFEGSAGWANIAGNGDGQGLSLGLNQQNFGQGTLQPMLTVMLKNNREVVKPLFTAANLTSLTSMLNKYAGAMLSVTRESFEEPGHYISTEELFPDRNAISPLDEGYSESQFRVMDAKTDASIVWAKANILTATGTVKADWKKSFVSLAVTAPYRSQQIQAALTMFAKAQGYYETLKFREMRSLLVLYDFVVQNGGFTASHLTQYRSYLAANPKSSETARLLKLLEIRLVSVREQYKADVRARKTTIINGTGKVHGATRNLPKEYCYASGEVMSASTLFITHDLRAL